MRARRFLLCCLILSLGCTDRLDDVIINDNEPVFEIEDEPRNDSLYNRALEVMRYKANLMASVSWSPLHEVYNAKGNYYPEITYHRMLYSSAKEKDKFVGLDVSFYSFLSSVYNPYSVIYTERIDELPYHGINCSTYYGTTCSSSVCFALGLGNQIPSADFQKSPLFRPLEEQTIDALEAGDVLASSGHSVLILDIQRDSSNTVQEVELLEIFRVYTMTREELVEFVGDSYSFYRFRLLQRNQEFETLPFDFTSANESAAYFSGFALCPSRGDRTTYSQGETVEIDILQNGYHQMALSKDGNLYKLYPIDKKSILLTNLPQGQYTAELRNESGSSGMVSFEVIDTIVSIHPIEKNSLSISFSSQRGSPHSIVICNIHGKQRLVHFLSKKEIEAGMTKLIFDNSADEQLYCKVLFSGEFGKVTNEPLAI